MRDSWRSTQIMYHEWNVRGGHVAFAATGIEIRLSRFDPNTWINGLLGVKLIPYESIDAGFTIDSMLRLVFDRDDEIIMNRRVLELHNPHELPFPILMEPFGTRSSSEVIAAMRLRQQALPPVSWELGRQGGNVRSATAARAIRVAPVFVAFAALAWLFLSR